MASKYNASYLFIDKQVENGFGQDVAIFYQDEQITYRQLQERINQFGNVLKQLGINMEQRILLACYDSPEFVASFFGAIKIGAIPVPVNTMMKPKDFEYFLNNSRSKVLVIQQDLWDTIKEDRQNFLYLEHIFVISTQAVNEAGVKDYCSWVEQASSELRSAHTCKSDAAFWLYSSGSTGDPKGVIHLQHDMEYAYENYARKILKIDKNDITFSASKLFFAYGLGNGMYFPLGAGASTVLMPDRPTPDLVFATIEKYKPTIFFGVPTLYGAMINHVEQSGKKYDLTSVRVCVSAGEALPAAYINKWKNLFNIDILDGIGSTEALHIYLSNQVGKIREGSSGFAVPGYEAKIIDEHGALLPPNETGNLWIKGDSIAERYWNLHEENKVKFQGEWFNTGDRYYCDEDGYYWYCGRSDDMLKIGGIWVSPIEVESSLLEHDKVLETAVVGEKNVDDLVKTKAYVVLKNGMEPSEELKDELKVFVKDKLAPYKYPRIIEFVDELPKTATGKIQRFKLRNI
ncbi:benzoate-CoA ligase family protein [Calidifontibacillus oryziterrae]|uniref:benzoate-CoA ligase family protein n=1 Tax=Calidifontibacillus oryziterrae TaxID=1191699 RepID=UPI000557C905|nr:benzoate-CoA ligase family protein [Calidifontibacillus oryziterrae]